MTVHFSWLQYGLFSFGVGPSGEYKKEKHGFTFDEKSNSITLDGTQVIGYTCALVPKYP